MGWMALKSVEWLDTHSYGRIAPECAENGAFWAILSINGMVGRQARKARKSPKMACFQR